MDQYINLFIDKDYPYFIDKCTTLFDKETFLILLLSKL